MGVWVVSGGSRSFATESRLDRYLTSDRMVDAGLIGLAAVTAFAIMPTLYVLAHGAYSLTSSFEDQVRNYVILNCAANFVAMLWSLQGVGRFDRKLAHVFSRALMLHGALALFVLTTRQFHSNQVMLSAAVASLILGAVVMTIKHRLDRPKAALLGRWDPLAAKIRMRCDIVSDPGADLSDYDLLLVPEVEDLPVEWTSTLSKALLMGKRVRHLDHVPPGGLTSYRLRKRVFDIALVLITAPVTVPLLLIGMVLVWASMGQPIFFAQARVGMGGRTFRIYKLRTMRDVPAQISASAGLQDPRITRVGRWLRRSRIDELPQLWNVLKGDMSVVGPRPEWDVLSNVYSAQLPVYAYRHLVRPGITGWAQVRGGYASNLEETRQKVGYDLFYIKNISFALDVQILVRTAWTLLSGSGAR